MSAQRRPLAAIARQAGLTRERVRQLVQHADISSGDCLHPNGGADRCARCSARRILRELGYFDEART